MRWPLWRLPVCGALERRKRIACLPISRRHLCVASWCALTNGAALINDSYNSSPAALQAMTAVLAATPKYHRRILAAGEMRELGALPPNCIAKRDNLRPAPEKSIGLSALREMRRKLSKARWPRVCLGRTPNFFHFGRSGKIFGGFRGIRRRDAGERLARREDGAHR